MTRIKGDKNYEEFRQKTVGEISKQWAEELSGRFFMKTAKGINAPLTGEIEITPLVVPLDLQFRDPFRINPIEHPHLWKAAHYKTVLDPETGWYVYPWELTPTYRSIKHIGRGNCSQEAI